LLVQLIAEEKRMFARISKSLGPVLVLAGVALMPVAMAAQAAPAAKGISADEPASKWDIFLGYSYLAPKGTVTTPIPYSGPTGGPTTVTASYSNINVGGIVSGSYFFNKYVGAQVEVGIHEYGKQNNGNPISGPGTQGNNDGFTTTAGGIILRFPSGKVTPFVHALVGAALVDGPSENPFTWGPDVTVGGGLDYNTPWFNHHLSIRIIQADYEYMHVNFGSGYYGGVADINAARISAGLVFHAGTVTPPSPVTLSCSALPVSVFPGDPVNLTAMAGSLEPKLNVVYSWSGDGVTGNGSTGTVATGALAPGSYTVKCGVKEGKPGKEGMKPWQTADATATYTVKAFEPPTISCSANPTTLKPGDSSTITASGISPQNRPLTYTYTASAGTITGNGATATYSSGGVPAGDVSITCNVSDDKGHASSANTALTITAPYVPPAPHTQTLCSISFAMDKKRPTRVDNEAKACLDEIALDLQKQADAKAVLVGEETSIEKTPPKHHNKHTPVVDIAAQRAVNAKEYLVTEKGIDASRVSVTTGATEGQTVEDYLVPAGATFTGDVNGTTPVDETTVKPVERKPLGEKHAHKKAAKATE
jgi:hypothetical protein